MAVPRQRIPLPPRCFRDAAAGLLRGDLWSGDAVVPFEKAFADRIGVGDAIACASGRAGFRAIIDALGLEPGDEIICSAFGYPVIPFLVKSMGYTLRLADCEMTTLGMDPAALEDAITDRTRAVVTTHLYGLPSRVDELSAVTASRGIALVEDCAHCLGSSVSGRQTGAWGDMAYFSFETSKMINTMGGGMVTARHADAAAHIRQSLKSEDRRTLKWLGKRLGRTSFERAVTGPLLFNTGVYPALRLASGKNEGDDRFASGYHGDHVTMKGRTGQYTNYQARLGLTQLAQFEARQKQRTVNARRLIEGLEDVVTFQSTAGPHATANYLLVAALFERRQLVADALLRRGVDTKHHYMRDCSGLVEDAVFPNATRAEDQVLHLPTFPEMSTRQVDRVIATVRAVVAELGERPAPRMTDDRACEVVVERGAASKMTT